MSHLCRNVCQIFGDRLELNDAIRKKIAKIRNVGVLLTSSNVYLNLTLYLSYLS